MPSPWFGIRGVREGALLLAVSLVALPEYPCCCADVNADAVASWQCPAVTNAALELSAFDGELQPHSDGDHLSLMQVAHPIVVLGDADAVSVSDATASVGAQTAKNGEDTEKQRLLNAYAASRGSRAHWLDPLEGILTRIALGVAATRNADFWGRRPAILDASSLEGRPGPEAHVPRRIPRCRQVPEKGQQLTKDHGVTSPGWASSASPPHPKIVCREPQDPFVNMVCCFLGLVIFHIVDYIVFVMNRGTEAFLPTRPGQQGRKPGECLLHEART